jgi:hypothetical protein
MVRKIGDDDVQVPGCAWKRWQWLGVGLGCRRGREYTKELPIDSKI